MMNIAIVAVGYNRPSSMKRLLNSLCEAKYDNKCDLIISLDYGKDQDELIHISENIEWKNGKKRIRAFKENQGLRNHILQCGDLTDEYDAVVVLEDDLVVAEVFFQYVTETVNFYKDNDKIAGISLYTHRTNPGNGRYFEAQSNGYDTFLMQYAQSWGQCWTKKMWRGFRNWYDSQLELDDDGLIPQYIVKWNKQSWLKYYIRYTVVKGLFHVYPYFSLTTNSSETGEHNTERNSAYQVPLVYGNNHGYRFPSIEQSVKYDVFFERIFDTGKFDKNNSKAIVDLYGLKSTYDNADVLYSTAVLNYHIIDEIGLQYRPHEVNLIFQEHGKGIYVYDLHHRENNKDNNKLRIASYDLRAENAKLTLLHGLNGYKRIIMYKLKKIFKKI